MKLEEFYQLEANHLQAGAHVGGRVRKAARLFQKHLGGAERLLDIGCGFGELALYLAQALEAREVYGVDISQKRVEEALARGVGAARVNVDSERLPFEDNLFDAIFCGEIIEHLTDTDHLLEEVHRVLNPRGLCILTTPNLASWFNRLALLLGWQPFETATSMKHEVGRPKFLVSDYGSRAHLRVFTYGALRELLRLHGFTVVEAAGSSLADIYRGLGDWSVKPLRAAIYTLVNPVDRLLSLHPSLGCRIIVALRKREESH